MSDKYGQEAAKNLVYMAKSSSKRLVQQWLMKLEAFPPVASVYIDIIQPSAWRSTQWLDNPTLQLHYDIVSTNILESMNNILSVAREVTWVERLDLILTKII